MNPVACIERQWERMGRIGSRAHERTHMHGRTRSASKHEPRPFASQMDASHGWPHMHRGAVSASVSGRAPRAWMDSESMHAKGRM